MDSQFEPFFHTAAGRLYSLDCMEFLRSIPDDSVDTVFADPPFNLSKDYGELGSDSMSDAEYVEWCHDWLLYCVHILRPGGSLFVYNLPKWNVQLASFLNEWGMDFRHWIAVEMNNSLPISNRLYPSHYSLIYYSKGKPNVFHRIRTPIETCRHCGGEIKDYGGHRNKMNPNGVTLKDVWNDIPPVRHRKFKSARRKSNVLSTKLLERVVLMSTNPGDLVVDPFIGSGTTAVVCEKYGRRWLGSDLNSAGLVEKRLLDELEFHRNDDFVEE